MSTEAEPPKVLVEEFARRVRGELVPLGKRFSYFSALPVAEEDLRQYLNDPLAAVSPAVTELLPNISILLAPFLEKGNGKSGEYISYERPAEGRQLFSVLHQLEDMTVLALSVKEIEVADYHYHFYAALAELPARDFVRRILVEAVGVVSVHEGGNFRFGHNAEAGSLELKQFGAEFGFAIQVHAPVRVHGLDVPLPYAANLEKAVAAPASSFSAS